MKRTSVPFFLSGKHTEAGVLRALKKKKQRQCMQLEEGELVIKEELSKEWGDGSVHKHVIRNITYISSDLFFIISGKGTSDH